MSVVSKKEVKFMRRPYMRVVSYSSRTRLFVIKLPKEAHKIAGAEVEGKTEEEVLKLFKAADAKCTFSAYKSKKLIVYQVRMVCDISRKGTKLHLADWCGDAGVSLGIQCAVMEKKIWEYGDGEKSFVYEELESTIPKSGTFGESYNSDNYEDCVDDDTGEICREIPWTAERESFFAELITSFEDLILKIHKTSKSKRKLVALADMKSKFLLMSGKEK